MWSTFLLITRGWFTVIPSWHGRDGIHILEYGLAGRISHLDLVLELDGSAALGGDGVIGDLTGITTMRFITMAGTTRGAARFTTATIITAAELVGVEWCVA